VGGTKHGSQVHVTSGGGSVLVCGSGCTTGDGVLLGESAVPHELKGELLSCLDGVVEDRLGCWWHMVLGHTGRRLGR